MEEYKIIYNIKAYTKTLYMIRIEKIALPAF